MNILIEIATCRVKFLPESTWRLRVDFGDSLLI